MLKRVTLVSIALMWAASSSAWARPARIILLRHAEKPADDNDPHLSPRGMERARQLPKLLTSFLSEQNDRTPAALIAPQPTAHGHSRRCLETLEPMAKVLHLPVEHSYAANDWKRFATDLIGSSRYDGKTVIVCWVHDYIPALAAALGVKKAPDWQGKTFDRLWIITYPNGKARLEQEAQRLLPGDSRR